jgi:hypothetical protein
MTQENVETVRKGLEAVYSALAIALQSFESAS